jgi:hypothetical protein
MPDEIIINEDIKRDDYYISINELVIRHQPRDVRILSNILDDNGYFGRHKINREYTKRYGDNNVAVEIYLPNSIFTYRWPLSSTYSLTRSGIIKNSNDFLHSYQSFVHPLDFLRRVNDKEAFRDIDKLSLMMFREHSTRDLLYNKQFIYRIMLLKYLVKNNILLRSKEDIVEIFHNLHNKQYKILHL